MLEVVAYVVDAHALLDLGLELFNGDADFADVLLRISQILDVLWWSLDSLVDLIELGRDLVVLLSGSPGDEFDLFLDNLLILAGVHVSDVLDVDREDRDGHALWNSLLKVILQESMLLDVLRESLG